jgi:predicted nucleotidyltransferase
MRRGVVKIPVSIDRVLDRIEKQAKPDSFFIYGSRARGDFKSGSDYEIGVLFDRDKKWGRQELVELGKIKGLNLYPFVYEDFMEYKPDTPFPRVMYMREMVKCSKTLRGRRVVESMKPPRVKLIDLLEDALFQSARAFTAVMSSRQGDWVSASVGFTKSVLFGVRTLVILDKGRFPFLFSEMAREALKLELDSEYQDLVKKALRVREGDQLRMRDLYTSISLLSQVVRPRIRREIKTGDRVILE